VSDQSQPPTEADTDDLSPEPVSPARGVVERARADLAAGREWKARDRLVGHLAEHHDLVALELLGEVYFAMRDLPSAGAAWFGTNRRGADVDKAIDAWRERHADHFYEMWRSLPRSVRESMGNKRVEALRRRAETMAPSPRKARPASGDSGGGVDAAVVIALGIGALFLVCAVIGFVTLLRWLVPG
jgi:hypothetical protein